jgi:hypothetical protein
MTSQTALSGSVTTAPSASERLVDQLSNKIGGLGVELADIAGNVQEVAQRVTMQSERFGHLQKTAETMVSKKVAANTKAFPMQTYRRDMGGGNFVLMKDLSSPIFVRGRHRARSAWASGRAEPHPQRLRMVHEPEPPVPAH